MREMYLDLRSKSFGVQRAQRLVIEAYQPESDAPVHEYKYASLQNFENKGGAERLSELEATFREGAVKRSFSHKGSRVGSLIEVATTILDRFRREDAKDALREQAVLQGETEDLPKGTNTSSLLGLSREFRESLAAIQKEVDPLGLSDATVKSFYEQQMDMFGKLSERGKDMLNVRNMPWLNQPTSPQ